MCLYKTNNRPCAEHTVNMKKSLKTIVKTAVAVTALSVMCAIAACSNSGGAKTNAEASENAVSAERELGGEKLTDGNIMLSEAEIADDTNGKNTPRGEHKGRRKPPVSALPDTSETADGETDEERPNHPPMPRGAIMFLIVPAPGAFDFLPPPPKGEEPETQQSGENETEQPAEEQTQG